MLGIKDVAKLAGVSISTVSNVINDTRYVSDELKNRVLKAIDTLDYEADFIARSMKKTDTMVIGVIIPSLKSIFVLPIINGIQSVASKEGYNLSFFASDINFDEELKSVKTLVSSKVDGIIIDSVADRDDKDYFKYLSTLKKSDKKIPVISIERNLTEYGINSVYVNNIQGGYLATSHLVENGCSKIIHIAGPGSFDIAKDRIYGYKKKLKEVKIPFDEEFLVKGDFTPISGYRAIRRLILNGIKFDGIFASNDQMATGALMALKEFNIKVPEEVKIVGFDNIFVSSILNPSLTTINVPSYRIGTLAMRHLLDILSRDNTDMKKASSIEIPISIIERTSTGNFTDNGWELEYW